MFSARTNAIQKHGALLALATLVVATVLWSLYNAHPIDLLFATAVYVLAVALPGRVLLLHVDPTLTRQQAWVFGSILAEITIGTLLKLTGASLWVGLLLPVIASLIFFTRKRTLPNEHDRMSLAQVAVVCAAVLGFLGLFLYGQAYDRGVNYHFGYNPTVDLTYFQTVLTSISNYGEFKDLAHLGYHFNYPDLGYQVLSFVHRVSGAEAFGVLFFFAPFKDFLLLSLALYALLSGRVAGWVAVIAALSFYILSSRSLLDLNVPITNPAYREGLYMLLLSLWAHDNLELKRRWLVISIGLIGLVLVKPAIWIVATPALLLAELLTALRSKRYTDLARLAVILAACSIILMILFAPGQSGLDGGHYEVIFGDGLRNTIAALGKIHHSFFDLSTTVIRPLSEVTFGGMLLGVLLFMPFLLQQIQHSGRLIALVSSLALRRPIDRLELQLLVLMLVCFAVLAFVGMEYSSFVHVYLLPLALTASMILLALSFDPIRRMKYGKIWIIILALGLVYDAGFAAYGYHAERTRKASVEVPSSLIEEFRKVRELTDTSSVLATYQTGLFQKGDERSYLAAAFTERKLLSEGAIYGSLIMGYQENIKVGKASPVSDTMRARRAASDSIFFSSDAERVRDASSKFGVTHILIRHGQGERILSPIGDTIFHGRMLTLLRL